MNIFPGTDFVSPEWRCPFSSLGNKYKDYLNIFPGPLNCVPKERFHCRNRFVTCTLPGSFGPSLRNFLAPFLCPWVRSPNRSCLVMMLNLNRTPGDFLLVANEEVIVISFFVDYSAFNLLLNPRHDFYMLTMMFS